MKMPCRSYCKHGGVCMLGEGHEGKHNSYYCIWDDKEGLTKKEADKIMIEKEPILGKFIAEREQELLNEIDKRK